MIKLLESFDHASIKDDLKTQYIRYRIGRLKHQYWLWNRKNKDTAYIDEYDYTVLKNCQPGKTVFFGSAGYYLKDIWPEIEVIEMHPVVKTFYKDVYICTDRKNISEVVPFKCDNFAVVNNRAEHWVNIDGLTDHLTNYTKIMNDGCRVFYSFRDTQIHLNRLKLNMEQHFLDWAISLEKINLKLIWHSIRFDKKVTNNLGEYDYNENPDTTNGNLKFMFVYKGEGKDWEVNI
jgi:hypothetical protein